MKSLKHTFFTPQRLIFTGGMFVGSILFLHGVLRAWRTETYFIMHQYWPLSVFMPKIPWWPDLVTVVAIALLFASLWHFYSRKAPLSLLVLCLFFLITATTLLQGIEGGFVYPIVGEGSLDHGYWQDAALIQSPGDFLAHYTWLQPTLGYHGRVHPPLPALLFYGVRVLTNSPIGMSFVLLLLSLPLFYFFYLLLRRYVTEDTARLVTMILGLLPAVQIYTLASIDGVIAAVFLGVVWAFDETDRMTSIVLPALLFIVASSLTFGVAWLALVVVAIDWVKHRQLTKSLQLFLITGCFWIVVWKISGFAYWESFFTAASFEGTGEGWYGLTDPLSYGVTRVQDVLEPVVFMGPFISLLVFLSLRFGKNHSVVAYSRMSVVIFFLFLLTGAYYTGETARAALYVLPMMLLSLGPLLESMKPSLKEQRWLLGLVLGQTVVMQLFGFYLW